MSVDPDALMAFEADLDLFSIEVDGVPLWERIRFQTLREIRQANGRGQAHTEVSNGIKGYLQGVALWAQNVIYRNPYLADKHDFLFFGHKRRKLEDDGYWWDPYSDPIHEQNELDYIHLENPHNLSHLSPAKTSNLRYNDLIEYTGFLLRKFGVRRPSLPDDVVSHFREAEATIDDRFDADIDLIAKARKSLHVRNTTLPLYTLLLDRIDPSVVVIVVSYGRETLIETCNQAGVPVVELQHGVIYDHHYGYAYPEEETKTTFPDYLLTFGEFWNENVRFPIPDDHVIPTGYPYLESRINTYDNIERTEQLLFISQGSIGQELSRFAVAVDKDPRIEHKIVYKLHPGEYNRWRDEYPHLAESDVTVVDEPEPPLYLLFASSSAQVGVYSTALYEGLCFDLETFVYDVDSADLLRPLVEDGTASLVGSVDDLTRSIGKINEAHFDRERFFKSNAVGNVIRELERIKAQMAR